MNELYNIKLYLETGKTDYKERVSFPYHLPKLVNEARLYIEKNLLDSSIEKQTFQSLLEVRLKEIESALFILELNPQFDNIIDEVKSELEPLIKTANFTPDQNNPTDFKHIFRSDEAETLFYFLHNTWEYNSKQKPAYIYNFFNDQTLSHSNLDKNLINKLTNNKTDYFNFCRDNQEISFKGAKIQYEKATAESHYKKLNELYESFKNLN